VPLDIEVVELSPEVGANVGSRDEWGCLPRQRLFADEWFLCRNATQAAIVAGYSIKNAGAVGPAVLKQKCVQRYLAYKEQELKRDYEARRQRLLDELELLSFSDIDHYRRGKGGTVTVIPGIDKRVTRAISKLKIKTKRYTDEKGRAVEEEEMDIGLHSKTAAVDMYMKHTGMFPATGTKLQIEDAEGNTLVIEEVAE
jgi:phage terminase small subunit